MHKVACHTMKCDVISDVKLFPIVYCRIYCHKILTLSIQMLHYKIKYFSHGLNKEHFPNFIRTSSYHEYSIVPQTEVILLVSVPFTLARPKSAKKENKNKVLHIK